MCLKSSITIFVLINVHSIYFLNVAHISQTCISLQKRL